MYAAGMYAMAAAFIMFKSQRGICKQTLNLNRLQGANNMTFLTTITDTSDCFEQKSKKSTP